MADKWASLIQQFVNVTGTSKKIAKSMLEACNGNLEMAIEMHLDSDSSTQAGPSSTDVGATSFATDSEDNVRAPIPQTRGILVEEPYHNFHGRRRTSKSVFDGFRDFQAEAMQQEMESSGDSERTRSRPGATKKRKTLQDLFRPPIDLLHKGTFETAKTSGQQQNKWLMVNVQDIKEFKCQQLNRDVWSNDAVRNVVQEHFVLWQVYRDSDEGDRYSQFYHVAIFPYIAILDPRTGEKMVEWGHVDAQSFCENATEFVLQHPYLESDSPPSKRRKKESIVDASEDSQLEAAIAASLQYSKCQETNTSGSENSSSEGEMGFTDSDSEHKETATRSEDNSQTSNCKVSTSSDCGENSTSRKPLSTFSSKSSESSCTRGMVTAGEGSSSLQSTMDIRNTGMETPPELDQGPVCTIMVRFPSGARKQVSLNASSPLMALVDFIQKEGYPSERFELLTNFPRKRLTDMDFGTSLQSAGLFPQDTVFVQER